MCGYVLGIKHRPSLHIFALSYIPNSANSLNYMYFLGALPSWVLDGAIYSDGFVEDN